MQRLRSHEESTTVIGVAEVTATLGTNVRVFRPLSNGLPDPSFDEGSKVAIRYHNGRPYSYTWKNDGGYNIALVVVRN